MLQELCPVPHLRGEGEWRNHALYYRHELPLPVRWLLVRSDHAQMLFERL